MEPKRKRAEMIFDKKTIEDHALRPKRRMGRIQANTFSPADSLDSVTKTKGTRTARSVTGGPSEGPRKILKKAKHAPFWQLAPDSKTIERLYSPEDEPLVGNSN